MREEAQAACVKLFVPRNPTPAVNVDDGRTHRDIRRRFDELQRLGGMRAIALDFDASRILGVGEEGQQEARDGESPADRQQDHALFETQRG